MKFMFAKKLIIASLMAPLALPIALHASQAENIRVIEKCISQSPRNGYGYKFIEPPQMNVTLLSKSHAKKSQKPIELIVAYCDQENMDDCPGQYTLNKSKQTKYIIVKSLNFDKKNHFSKSLRTETHVNKNLVLYMAVLHESNKYYCIKPQVKTTVSFDFITDTNSNDIPELRITNKSGSESHVGDLLPVHLY